MKHAACLIALVWSTQIAAQQPIPVLCNPTNLPYETEIQEAAQATLPVVLRNAFDAQGRAPDGLNLTIRLPDHIASQVPCPDLSEPVRNIRLRADGLLEGEYWPNSRSSNGIAWDAVIVFAPSHVIDWMYYNDDQQGAYGAYFERAAEERGVPPGRHLAPTQVPEGWE